MAAPSKSWVTIVDSQVDADSPLDTTLVTGLRDDLVHLREWLGKDYTATQNHKHDGADSAAVDWGSVVKTSSLEIFDDFCFFNTASSVPNWWTGNATYAYQNAVNGVLRFSGGTGTEFKGILQAGRPFQISGGLTVTYEARIKKTDVTYKYLYAGLMDALSGTTNHVALGDTSNGANFKAISTLAGSTTQTDTGVVIDTAWHVFKIVATPSSVLFYIDGVLKATHTTNIPTTNLGPAIGCYDAGAVDVDYVRCYQTGRN